MLGYKLLEGLKRFFGRILNDVMNLRNIEIYVLVLIIILFTFYSLLGELPSWLEGKELTLIMASLGLLLFNISIPQNAQSSIDDVLNDRSEFSKIQFVDRIKGKKTLWIQAASAVNILSQPHVLAIHKNILSRSDGEFIVVIQNPDEKEAMKLLVQQLDDSVDIKVQEMEESLATSIKILDKIKNMEREGNFSYHFLDYSPGFSMIAINPYEPDGLVIVEMYGFHNTSTESRMHFQISRTDSETWYNYWISQFEHMVAKAK